MTPITKTIAVPLTLLLTWVGLNLGQGVYVVTKNAMQDPKPNQKQIVQPLLENEIPIKSEYSYSLKKGEVVVEASVQSQPQKQMQSSLDGSPFVSMDNLGVLPLAGINGEIELTGLDKMIQYLKNMIFKLILSVSGLILLIGVLYLVVGFVIPTIRPRGIGIITGVFGSVIGMFFLLWFLTIIIGWLNRFLGGI